MMEKSRVSKGIRPVKYMYLSIMHQKPMTEGSEMYRILQVDISSYIVV